MEKYSFDISLSILNHLGRNLYRSFITVLGEAISNAWDANAENVYIDIDRESSTFTIRDDGEGMDSEDFQRKFLKIGYSKRKDGDAKSKGKDDMSAGQYLLGEIDENVLKQYGEKMTEQGTTIIFDEVKDGIRNRVEYIRKLIALYFRFSLIDNSFKIIVNDSPITLDELNDLVGNTQFVWTIGDCKDPFVTDKIMTSGNFLRSKALAEDNKVVTGFIATVDLPSHIKIKGTDEKVTIDLYVNGRLREKDILKHLSNPRIVASYVYGQIHFDSLDDETDRFTSSREGVVSDDPKFKELLAMIDKLFKEIINDWDKWRVESHKEGDSENIQIAPRERKAKALVDEVAVDYIPKGDTTNKDKVKKWVEELHEDASFNVSSYTECFISENLLRKYIVDQKKPISDIAEPEGKKDTSKASLHRDGQTYKPMRDAMAHTARLTQAAKTLLTGTFENIKARVVTLLSKSGSDKKWGKGT